MSRFINLSPSVTFFHIQQRPPTTAPHDTHPQHHTVALIVLLIVLVYLITHLIILFFGRDLIASFCTLTMNPHERLQISHYTNVSTIMKVMCDGAVELYLFHRSNPEQVSLLERDLPSLYLLEVGLAAVLHAFENG